MVNLTRLVDPSRGEIKGLDHDSFLHHDCERRTADLTESEQPRTDDPMQNTRIGIVVVWGLLAFSGCAGAQSGTGDCHGYSCDEDGAKEMFTATLEAKYEPSERAKASFETVFATAAATMKKGDGFTPDNFDLAKNNLEKILGDIQEGPDDTLLNTGEELRKGTSRVCPLYPFCVAP